MKPDLKKLVILNLPYLLFVYLFGKVGEAYRLAAGADLTQKMLHFMDSLAAAFANGLPSFHPFARRGELHRRNGRHQYFHSPPFHAGRLHRLRRRLAPHRRYPRYRGFGACGLYQRDHSLILQYVYKV